MDGYAALGMSEFLGEGRDPSSWGRKEEARPAHHDELARLNHAWDRHRASQRAGMVLVVHGPQGASVGALLKEWRRHLMRQGEPIVEVSCGLGDPTFGVLRELVSASYALLDELGLVGPGLLQELFGELSASLGLPGASALGAGRGLGGALPGQIHFYELLGRFFVEATRLRPLVLVLQNLHLGDASTRAAISYLAQNFALDPVDEFALEGVEREGFRGVLCLGVQARPGRGEEALVALQRGLRDRLRAEFVDLGRVDEETVRRFLQTPQVIARVLEATGGNPAELEALLGLLPSDASELLLRRLSALSEGARGLAEALAVRGKPAPPDFLVELVKGLGVEPGRGLGELLEAGLLARKVQRGQVEVAFAQEDAWGWIYARMDEARRRALHGRVGEVLEERRRFGHAVEAEEIAAHYLQGQERAKALRYALEAAERLHMAYAFERARQFLERALELLRQSGPSDPAVAASLDDVYGRLVDISSALGEPKRALFYCGQLKKRRAGQGLAEVYRRVGRVLLGMGKYDLAERALGRALERTGEDPEARARVLGMSAEALYGRGQYGKAEEVCKQGLALVAEGKGEGGLARLGVEMKNTLGKVCLFREDYDQAAAYFRENSEVAERRGWADERVRAWFNLGTLAVARRNYQQAEEIFSKCLSFSHSTANTLTRAFSLMNLAVLYQRTFRYRQAIDYYLHALAAFKKSGNDLQFAVTAVNLADIYESLGDLPKARALVEAALELTRAGEMRYFHARACGVKGRVLLREGDAGGALDSLRAAYEGGANAGRVFRARILLQIARANHLLGQAQERDRALGELDLTDTTPSGQELRGDAALYRSWMWADDGDFQGAELHAREARKVFSDAELWDRLWLACFQLARVCRGLGRLGEAKLHAGEAARLVVELRERVPEALRERFDRLAECEGLGRLQRALERGDPFEAREVDAAQRAALAEDARGASLAERAVVRVGAPQAVALAAWRQSFGGIVGEDARLHHLFRMVDKVAASDSTVLLVGESGTGKELFAEAIHLRSARKDGPLVKVNCAAFVETLLLSELFGHEKGAFTGALSRKKGRFEMAQGGTIFLDEIGDISPNTQVALLRVLQEREIERVGGGGAVSIDVRVIAATNRNLEEMVRQGSFRLDLYYRLKGVVLELPPLRERRADIPRLVRHFAEREAEGQGRARYFSYDALRLLASYNWPGNIRELENFVRSMLLFVDDEVIQEEHIREFDEFFAEGEMAGEIPRIWFEAGWWSPPKPPSVAAPEEPTPAQDEVSLSRALLALSRPDVPARVLEPSAPSAPVEALEGAAVAAEDGDEDDEGAWREMPLGGLEQALIHRVVGEGVSLQDLKKRLELECIKQALLSTEGNITHAASVLKMKRPRLSQIINAHPELEEVRRRFG